VILVGPEGARCQPAADYADKGPQGKPGARPTEVILQRFPAAADGAVLLVSRTGQAWKGTVARLAAGVAPPDGDRLVFGGALQAGRFVVLGTRKGNVKRVSVEDVLGRGDNSWGQLIGLEDDQDEVLFAGVAGGEAHVWFCTGGGNGQDARLVRFEAGTVNPQATPSARGVAAIKLVGEPPIGGGVFDPDEAGTLVFLSAGGFLKRVALAEFPVQGRGSQGVMALKVTPVTGPVASAAYAPAGSLVNVYSAKGRRLRLALDDVEEARRPAAGANLHKQYGDGKLFDGETLARVAAY
jgi:DNA gyrase subunit A